MKVSVIVPTVGRDTLRSAINSIARQTHSNLEVIIVDDSKNQSIQITGHELLKTGGSKGPGYARNMGTQVAQGELIAFLDDDDLWKERKIQQQIEDIQENNIDVLISGAEVNGKNRPLPKFALQIGIDPLELLYLKPHLFRSQAYLPTASYLVKAKVFKEIKFNENMIDRENILFLSECFKRGFNLSQNAEALIEVNYRKSQSLSRMSLESERDWFHLLATENQVYGRNFLIESARNFLRRKDFTSAGQMLKLIW